MHNPLVSILIPLYNAEQYIEETITKALEQTYSNTELVIVDDHSTDNSLKIAQKYASEKVHIYSNPKKGVIQQGTMHLKSAMVNISNSWMQMTIAPMI